MRTREILAIIGIIAGMGFCWLILPLCYLFKRFDPLYNWVCVQAVVGWLVILGFPALYFVEPMMAVNFFGMYSIFSVLNYGFVFFFIMPRN